MTNKEINEITSCNEWIKIDYKFNNSTGTIIIKKQLYDRRWKKIKKLFKDVVEIELDEKYNLTLEELIDMDNEVNRLKNAISKYNKEIETSSNWLDQAQFKNSRDYCIKRLDDRLKEIKDEYNDRS